MKDRNKKQNNDRKGFGIDNISRMLGLLFLLTIILQVGCSDIAEESSLSQQDDNVATRHAIVEFSLSDGVNTLTRSMLTRAAGDTVRTPALEREKMVRNLYAVVFHKDDSTHYETFIAHKADSFGTYRYDILQPGEYLMCLVANPADSLAARLERGVPKLDSLARLLVEQNPGNDDQSTEFLMTSEPMLVEANAYSVSRLGTIKLVRSSARFDFYNRVPLLRLTKITFNNRNTTSRLYSPVSTSGQSKENRGYFFFSDSTGHELIGTMYGYENLDNPATTSFTVEGLYNGVAVKPYTITFPADKQIRRNMLYSIILSPREDIDSINPNDVFGSLKYEIEVNDWSEGAEFSWLGEDLFNREIPNFVVSGNNVFMKNGIRTNPEEIFVSYNTDSIVLDVTSTSTSSVLKVKGKNTWGFTIVELPPTDANGKMTQHFKILMPDSIDYTLNQPFMLCNKFDKTQRRTFNVKVGYYEVHLMNRWVVSPATDTRVTSYGDTVRYNTVYKSNDYHAGHGTTCSCYITIYGYDEFVMYVRSNGESGCDWMNVSNLDKSATRASSTDTNNKYTSYGAPSTSYTKLTYSNIGGGTHTINIMWSRDGSVFSNEDAAFFWIPPDYMRAALYTTN